LLLALCSPAAAQDPGAGLAEAESIATETSAKIPALTAAVRSARAQFGSAKANAAPVESQAREATARVDAIEDSQRQDRLQAAAAIRRIEGERDDAAEEHASAVRGGIGLAIGALIMALIALAWGWFRATMAVAYLTRIQLVQAVCLCVGLGFLAVLIGAIALSAGGVVGVLGFAIVFLGIALPVAFLLARHSAEIQRGRAKPMMGRDRMPALATRVIAGIFALLFLIGIGSAGFADEAASGEITARLRQEAEGSSSPAPALIAARGKAARLEAQAQALAIVTDRHGQALSKAKGALDRAKSRLAAAEGDVRRFSRRLVAIEAREIEEQERQERRAQKLAEQEEREYQQLVQEEQAESGCDPNYSGCLDAGAIDYDCEGGSGDGPLYTGTVEVLGVDYYELDDDGDGIGCDP
jgi:hypothetical protein